MRDHPRDTGGKKLREELRAIIEATEPDLHEPLTDDTSLLKSGRLDSRSLFEIAVFIEREIEGNIDFAAVDLATEWDTLNDMVAFIHKRRSGR